MTRQDVCSHREENDKQTRSKIFVQQSLLGFFCFLDSQRLQLDWSTRPTLPSLLSGVHGERDRAWSPLVGMGNGRGWGHHTRPWSSVTRHLQLTFYHTGFDHEWKLVHKKWPLLIGWCVSRFYNAWPTNDFDSDRKQFFLQESKIQLNK